MKKFGFDYLFREALLLCVGWVSLWDQPEKKDQEKFFFGRRLQSRAATTTTLFVRACVRACTQRLWTKKNPVLCFELRRENVLLLFVFVCLFKKEEVQKIWPIKLDVRQRSSTSLAFKMNRHVAAYQPQSCSSESHSSVRNVKCHVATNRYHLTNIERDVEIRGSVVERRVGLLEPWVRIPFEVFVSGCGARAPVNP